MKKPAQQEKRSWSRYLVCFGFLTIFGLWATLLYRSFSTDILQIAYKHPDDFKISPYLLGKTEYIQQASLFYGSNVPSGPEEQYPKLFPLKDLLNEWPSTHVGKAAWQRSVAHPSRGKNALYRFDYMNTTERQLAFKYRDLDLPYILYNIPDLDKAALTEFSISNLQQHLSGMPRMVEKSESNKFMYYTMRNPILTGRRFPDWKAPQTDVLMTFTKFLGEVEAAENSQSEVVGQKPLHYLMISASEGGRTSWIRSALPFFEPEESLFMKEPNMYRGVNCRFGMKGVAAAAHYDSRRNYVAMIRGRKRYVLLPPGECPKLDLFMRGHPSVRHSRVDWSNLTAIQTHEGLSQAMATEVVVGMGEMLYIPSFWFHYIISQDASIQCNARSGESEAGKQEISQCGFLKRSELETNEEQEGGGGEAEEEEEGGEEVTRTHQQGNQDSGADGKEHLRRRSRRHHRSSPRKRQIDWAMQV